MSGQSNGAANLKFILEDFYHFFIPRTSLILC